MRKQRFLDGVFPWVRFVKEKLATRSAIQVLKLLRGGLMCGILGALIPASAAAADAKRPFRPADDIGLALFQYAGVSPAGGVLKYSPDGHYLAVVTERGRLDLGAPEDTIWLFHVADLERFVRRPEGGAPAALPLVRLATAKDGPLIENVRWLPDSSGIAFTAVKKSSCCSFHQLYLADITTRSVRALTPDNQDVVDFDIRSANSYVYEVKSPLLLTPPKGEEEVASVLTGRSVWDTVFPRSEYQLEPFNLGGLWAVMDGRRRKVLDSKTYRPPRAGGNLSLAPDGRKAVAIVQSEHPRTETWVRYKAPFGYGKFNLPLDISTYYLIDLTSGAKKELVNAPTGLNKDWHSYLLRPVWSADGQSVVLPNTFLPLNGSPKEVFDRESHPYVAVLRLNNGKLTGILALRAGFDPERYAINNVRLDDNRTLVVNFDRSTYLPDGPATAVFHQLADGTWRQSAATEDPRLSRLPFEVKLREAIDQPPELIVQNRKNRATRVLWNPNPQLSGIELASAQVISWKDSSGYDWQGGLLKPPNYRPGKRYPLIVQTHGFVKSQFLSSGIFTTAFAAQALAARGFVVLQVGWNGRNLGSAQEGPDQVLGFETAVDQLSNEGLIDSSRVGVIGFSRTVYHVLYALTAAKSLFAAASVTDGVNYGYFEYLSSVDMGLDDEAKVNGGEPLTPEGMKKWLEHSPEFNMSNVRAPLMFLQPGPEAVFGDWEPYADLRYLRKPVDLIMLQPGTHVMTNPSQREAAETLNVDWFRFWLQGYEDTDPAKRDQYLRWERLCDMQRTQNPTRPAFCVGTRSH